MATLSFDVGTVGAGRTVPVFANHKRPLKFVTGSFTFDSSYPTGGEDISSIFNKFATCNGIYMEAPLDSAGTGKHVVIDYTNKKAMLYTNAAAPAEVANASDQSGAASLRFIAWGISGASQTE